MIALWITLPAVGPTGAGRSATRNNELAGLSASFPDSFQISYWYSLEIGIFQISDSFLLTS